MGYVWYRNAVTLGNYGIGSFQVIGIPAGYTYRRIRFSWGFSGDTADTVDLDSVRGNLFVMGLVTTIGNGTETPPAAVSASGDVAPPSQRWLWWEARQPVITAVDHAAGVVTWRDSGTQEVPDVKVPVLAPIMPAGDTLNLWASWQAVGGGWDVSGTAQLWIGMSVLFHQP